MAQERLLSPKELSQAVGISVTQIRALMNEGRLTRPSAQERPSASMRIAPLPCRPKLVCIHLQRYRGDLAPPAGIARRLRGKRFQVGLWCSCSPEVRDDQERSGRASLEGYGFVEPEMRILVWDSSSRSVSSNGICYSLKELVHNQKRRTWDEFISGMTASASSTYEPFSYALVIFRFGRASGLRHGSGGFRLPGMSRPAVRLFGKICSGGPKRKLRATPCLEMSLFYRILGCRRQPVSWLHVDGRRRRSCRSGAVSGLGCLRSRQKD